MPSDAFKRSKIGHYPLILVLGLSLSACGKMGSKDTADRTLKQTNACLDTIGDRVERYFDGTIEESEWVATFDCVADQVDFFSRYVRGETPTGYSQNDIDAMVRKFLITDRALARSFVPSLFDLKASLFGGSPTVVTKDELQKFLKLNSVIREETRLLLPYLAARAKNPSEANTLRFVDALQTFGSNIGKYFSASHGDHSVSKESFLPFAREIIRLSKGDQTYVDKYGDVARHLKAVVSGGKSDFIESASWSKIFQEGTALGSLVLAMRDADKTIVFKSTADEYAFQLQITRNAIGIIERILGSSGGAIPLSLLDPVIDTIPLDDFSKEQREALKKDLRPILFRTLKGGTVGYLTPQAVRTAMDVFESGMKTQIHLSRIYQNLPQVVVPREFEAAAEKYKSSLTQTPADQYALDRRQVDDLISLAKTFQGQFPHGSGEMRFSSEVQSTRTFGHLNRMQWFQKAIRHAFSIYATEPTSSSVKQAKSDDLVTLVADFDNILRAWKKVRNGITQAEVAAKRFREGNLFMPVSNGDKLLNEIEATYYISYLFSSGAMSNRVFDSIVYDMGLCRPGNGMVDEVGNAAVEAKCFRKAYFGNIDLFWNNFPDLIEHYKKLKPSAQISMQNAMERAARTKGISEDPIGPFDMDSFAALPHYLESIIQRFDVNNDQVLDKNEVLNRAYPIFKDTLATLSGRTQDWLLQGALTYVIKFGKMPKTKAEQVQLLAWCAWRPFWKISADRAALYQVIAILSEPMPKKPKKDDILLPDYTDEELNSSHLSKVD